MIESTVELPESAGVATRQPCIGMMLSLDTLDSASSALAALPVSQVSCVGGTLHIALRGRTPLDTSGSSSPPDPSDPTTSSPVSERGSDGGPRRQHESDAVISAFAAAVVTLTPALQVLGFETLSFLCLGRGEVVRAGFRWNSTTESYVRNALLSHVEPPTAALLELEKLEMQKATYTPLRNRQMHAFVVREKATVGSYTLKRVFLRGLVRQVGKPALLSAMYENDPVKAAKAAMAEVEDTLEGGLQELQRISASTHDFSGSQVQPPFL